MNIMNIVKTALLNLFYIAGDWEGGIFFQFFFVLLGVIAAKVKLKVLAICCAILFVLMLVSCGVRDSTEKVPYLIGINYENVREELKKAEIEATVKYIDENGVCICTIYPDGELEGELPENNYVVSGHIPKSNNVMFKSDGVFTVYLEKKVPENSEDPDIAIDIPVNYSSASLIENYTLFSETINEENIQLRYPQTLFAYEESQINCPLYNPGEVRYFAGQEDGLFIWIASYSPEQTVAIGELQEEYINYYLNYFTNGYLVDENQDEICIITGLIQENEIGYILIEFNQNAINTLYISFPYEEQLKEDEFDAYLFDEYPDYITYQQVKEEEYRLKTYMVTLIYMSCSFSHSTSKYIPYSEYYVSW